MLLYGATLEAPFVRVLSGPLFAAFPSFPLQSTQLMIWVESHPLPCRVEEVARCWALAYFDLPCDFPWVSFQVGFCGL